MNVILDDVSAIPPGERKFYEVNGREIVVLNVDGQFYALRNYCPHMGGPLGHGPVKEHEKAPCGVAIACPFHHWTFDIECGDATFSEKRTAQTYDVTVVDDEIQVEL